jgi:hypothetical protein
MKLPRAILSDLDDTILVAFGPAQSQWRRTIAAFADQLGPIERRSLRRRLGRPRPNYGPIRRGTILVPPHRCHAPPHRRDRLCRARGGRPSGTD